MQIFLYFAMEQSLRGILLLNVYIYIPLCTQVTFLAITKAMDKKVIDFKYYQDLVYIHTIWKYICSI